MAPPRVQRHDSDMVDAAGTQQPPIISEHELDEKYDIIFLKTINFQMAEPQQIS